MTYTTVDCPVALTSNASLQYAALPHGTRIEGKSTSTDLGFLSLGKTQSSNGGQSVSGSFKYCLRVKRGAYIRLVFILSTPSEKYSTISAKLKYRIEEV